MNKSSTARAVSLMAAVWLLFPAASHSADTLTVIFTGDILLDRGVRRVIDNRGIDHLFSPAMDSLFAHADAVVGNLECPATQIKAPAQKRFIFRAEPQWLNALRQHGFTHLNLANNHSVDQGRRGLMDTRDNIIRAGMTPFGADTTMKAAAEALRIGDGRRPVYVLGSLRMPLENFSLLPQEASVSMEGIDSLAARIAYLREREPDCCIIVCPHWGIEHTEEPSPLQRMEARRIIQAGADCIVGHHSHTRQHNTRIMGRPVYYGLGNFIFDQERPLNSHALVLKVCVTEHDITITEVPIEIRRCVPHIVDAPPN